MTNHLDDAEHYRRIPDLNSADRALLIATSILRHLREQSARPSPATVESGKGDEAMPSPMPANARGLHAILEWCARNGYEPVEHEGVGIFIGGKRWWIDANGIIDMKRPNHPDRGECAVRVPRELVQKIESIASYPKEKPLPESGGPGEVSDDELEKLFGKYACGDSPLLSYWDPRLGYRALFNAGREVGEKHAEIQRRDLRAMLDARDAEPVAPREGEGDEDPREGALPYIQSLERDNERQAARIAELTRIADKNALERSEERRGRVAAEMRIEKLEAERDEARAALAAAEQVLAGYQGPGALKYNELPDDD